MQPLMDTHMADTYDQPFTGATDDYHNSDLCEADGEESVANIAMSLAGPPTAGSTSTTTTATAGAVRDRFCWVCHKDKSNVQCKQCPRSYHLKCIPTNTSNTSINNNNNSSDQTNSKTTKSNNHNKKSFDSWICIECKDILNDQTIGTEDTNESTAEDSPPKSLLGQMSVEEMSQLLTYALQTIRQSADPTFHKPVPAIVFPDYHQLVSCPMDLLTIDRNIKSHKYRSQMAFLADIKWIVHNCIIYNHNNHPLTTNAKYLSRVAKNEMTEMEICPDCFKNFYTVSEMSFAEPCRRPHQLVFARVKGYPLWPAKVVRLGKPNEVDCRFFGTHDRAWVTTDSCWLVSEVHPGAKPTKAHKSKFESAMRELAVHVDRLKAKFADRFKYSPQKTPLSSKHIFICEEDNEYYNRLVEWQSAADKSPENSDNSMVDMNTNTNSSDTNDKTGDDSNASKPVIPGVFSLTSDKVLDDLKSEIKISNESTNLLNKNIKANMQTKEDTNSKSGATAASRARVGKRNVAEALRASKILRTASTSSTGSSTSATSPSHRSTQSNSTPNSIGQTSSNAHNQSTGKSKAMANQSPPQSSQQSSTTTAVDNSLHEELERLKKQLNLERAMHKQEIREMKHNSDLVLMEMRQSWVTERDKGLDAERQKHELERKLSAAQLDTEKKRLTAAIDETKRKQWCAECLKEAQLFCCYDTWYCTYECQKSHWKNHVNVCQQIHKKS